MCEGLLLIKTVSTLKTELTENGPLDRLLAIWLTAKNTQPIPSREAIDSALPRDLDRHLAILEHRSQHEFVYLKSAPVSTENTGIDRLGDNVFDLVPQLERPVRQKIVARITQVPCIYLCVIPLLNIHDHPDVHVFNYARMLSLPVDPGEKTNGMLVYVGFEIFGNPTWDVFTVFNKTRIPFMLTDEFYDIGNGIDLPSGPGDR